MLLNNYITEQFVSNNTNSFLIKTVPHPSNIPAISLDNAPLVLKKLGCHLESYTASSLANKKLERSQEELQGILNKINQLIQAHQTEENLNFSHEILLLSGKVKELEVRIEQFKLEGKISDSEAAQFLDVATGFHHVLSTMENWFSFQEHYFALSDKLCDSLETISPSVFSDLHGWNLTAFNGVIASIQSLMSLFEISEPIFQQKNLFTPELSKQLSGDVHALSWGCSDWFYEINRHFNNVLSLAEKQWELAKQKPQTLETYSEMIIAAEQLLSMQKMLEGMQETLHQLPDFQSMADNIDIEKMYVGTDERASKKMIKRDLETLASRVAEAKAKLPNRLNQVNEVIEDHQVGQVLAEVNEKLKKIDFNPVIEKIFQEYEEKDIDHYVNVKAQLKGILSLPDSKERYPEIHAFCHQEEARLSQGQPIDFDELVLAHIMKKGQLQPGLFSRILQTITDPSSWSERTKYWVHVGCLGLQLIDHVSKLRPEPLHRQKEVSSLTKEQEEKLNVETAYLRTILTTEKFSQVQKNPQLIEKLAVKSPEIIPVLKEIVKYYPTPPNLEKVMDGYRAYRQEMMLNGNDASNLEGDQRRACIPSKSSKN